MNRYEKFVIFSTLIVYCAIFIPAVSAMLTSDISLPFHQNLDISGAQEYRIINQEKAPLHIEFNVNPEMVTDIKYIMPKYGSTEGYNQTTITPSQNSWFQITIINSNTSKVLATDGYGKTFARSNKTTAVPVLLNGPYTVLITGSSCTVDLSIKGSGTENEYSPTASSISSSPPTTQQIVTSIPTVIPSSIGNSNTTSPIIIILALLLLAGVGYGIYWMKRKSAGDQPHEREEEKTITQQPSALTESWKQHDAISEEFGNVLDAVQENLRAPDKPKREISVTNLESITASAKPHLSLTLDRTQMATGKWDKVGIQIKNTGDSPAVDVNLSFSDDFEVRGLKPVTVNAGETVSYDIGLFPKTKGTVPLEITAVCHDLNSQEYRSTHDLWIDVLDQMNLTQDKDAAATPVQSSVSQFTPIPHTPKQLPQEFSYRYTESEFIGKGGFARVFKAKRKDGKYVAVKIPISLDASTGRSFIAEMQNWTKLDHPNIVRVFEYNILPMAYFEMELCDGSLAETRKPVEVEEAAWILFSICEGLKYTHKRSIVHRDLKPQNILLKNGVPKISDWGLSRIISESTTTTATSFTPYYAAPEQIGNKVKDERTDIWQLGVILYEFVTGKLPFKGDSMIEIGMDIAIKDPKRPGEIKPDAKVIDAVVMKCLEKDPTKRYQSVLELQKDLAMYLRKNYAELLKTSVNVQDFTRSAYYCGDLVMINLLTGDMKSAYKYLLDFVHYSKGDMKAEAQELSEQILVRMEYGIEEIPDELITKADIIVHQVNLGFRNKG